MRTENHMETAIHKEIDELGRMTVGQLRQKYISVFGEESRSRDILQSVSVYTPMTRFWAGRWETWWRERMQRRTSIPERLGRRIRLIRRSR